MLNEIESICNSYTGKALNFKLLEFVMIQLKKQSDEGKFATMVADLKETYRKRLSNKTGWGSKELMVEFNEAMIDVLSRMVK